MAGTSQIPPAALSISTNDESYVFHLYHTARLFTGGVIDVETSLSGADLSVERLGHEIRLTDHRTGTVRITSGTDKECCKRALFAHLSAVSGLTVPWGTHIGVRPTKIVSGLMRRGQSPAQIRRHLRETYRVSEARIELALQVAAAEALLLKQFADGRIGIYIDLPFCPGKCAYCSFLSYPSSDAGRLAAYEAVLLKDIARTGAMLRELGLKPGYVYFGGGTPTSPDVAAFGRILDAIRAAFLKGEAISEFTVEAGRPDTITEAKLRIMKAAGVTRISINPQTFSDRTLAAMGRRHSAADIESVFALARSLDFADINMDLILGLPGEDLADSAQSIRRAIALAPENITVHGLALKKGAALDEIDESARRIVPQMAELVYEELAGAGYAPYYLYRNKNTLGNIENIGFTRPGYASRYNIAMIEETDTICACGASGVTRVVTGETGEAGDPVIRRHAAYKDLDLYLRGIDTILASRREVLSLARERR